MFSDVLLLMDRQGHSNVLYSLTGTKERVQLSFCRRVCVFDGDCRYAGDVRHTFELSWVT